MKKSLIAVTFAASNLLLASPAQAYDWAILAHVTSVELTYVPTQIRVALDAAASASCPTGTYLVFTGNGATIDDQKANLKQIAASLVVAQIAGSSVRIYGVNAGCTIQYVYMG